MSRLKTGQTRRQAAGLIGGAALAAPTIIRSAFGQDLRSVDIAYDGYTISTDPLYYGIKQGIFRKYGLDMKLRFVEAGTTLTQAIIGGSVEIGQNGYTPAIAAGVQGADIVLIGSISAKLPFQLVVRKDIKTAAELRGKKIAVSRLGTSSDTAAGYAVAHLGLKRGDVIILQLGGEGTRNAALLSGQVDGSMEQLPRVAELADSGKFYSMVDCTVVAGDYPNTCYVCRRSWLEKNRNVAKQFIAGFTDSIHQFKTDKPGALASIADFLKTPNDHALSVTYDSFCKDVFPDIPAPSLKGIQIVLDNLAKKNPKAASVKPEQLVDMTAIDQLKQEGFFQKLLG